MAFTANAQDARLTALGLLVIVRSGDKLPYTLMMYTQLSIFRFRHTLVFHSHCSIAI